MEIERKWLVQGWPQGLEQTAQYAMRQGYISVRPTVRIREERHADETEYILCFKKGAGLVRQEIETRIDPELFHELEELIGAPLVPKQQRRYALADGLVLEVNRVDEGAATEFWYAEIEYPTEEAATAWQPPAPLQAYLSSEVTSQPGQSMGAYWEATRGAQQSEPQES